MIVSLPFFLLKTMGRKQTMYSYLAGKVPNDVHFTLNKFDHYPKASNEMELEKQIKHFVNTNGHNGLMELAKIHPDRELIEAVCSNCKKKDKEIDNFNISSTLLSNNYKPEPVEYFNATGGNVNEEKMVNKMTINSIIVGGFVLLGVALMLKK